MIKHTFALLAAMLLLGGCAPAVKSTPGQTFAASEPDAGLFGFNPTAGEVPCPACCKN